MRTLFSIGSALTLALAIGACAASTDDPAGADGDQADQGNEQDLTAAKSRIKGSWTISSDSKDLTSTVAYEFRPNGDFWRDDNKILNGVLVNGAPQPVARTSGTYVVNTTKHTITLHITDPSAGTEVVSFTYTAGKILNGVMLPGHESDHLAHLTLTQQPAKGSHVAFPALKFDTADSYCTSTTDCQDEAKDKTWAEGVGAPAVSCDQKDRVCIAAVADPGPVKCGANTCGAGEYCCNASCGMCEKKGAMCPMIACGPVIDK